MQSTRIHTVLKLRHLISKAGIKLIEVALKHQQGIDLHYAHLGEVALYYDADILSIGQIHALFEELGFEIIQNPEDALAEAIRIAAIELIHYANNVNSLIRNSDYISEKLGMSYDKLSRIYSKHTGSTLEQYLIRLKIEKAKELILSNAFSLSEISYMLGYSSVQYLSNQFKKTTGYTVSQFRELPHPELTALEDLR